MTAGDGVANCVHATCNHPWTAFDTWVIAGLGVAMVVLIVAAVWFHRALVTPT